MLVTPAKGRARPPAIIGMKGSFKTDDAADQPTYDFIPEPDYSPPPSPTGRSGDESGIRKLERDKQSSGVYKQVISRRDSQENQGFDSRESGFYNNVIRNEPQNKRTSGEFAKAIKAGPGAVNVMPNSTEFPKLRRVGSRDTNETLADSERTSPREIVSRNSLNVDQKANTNNKFSVKQMQSNIENIYINDTKDRNAEKSDKIPSPRDKLPGPRNETKILQPAPSGHRRAPPPPVNNVPPAPPACSVPCPPPPGPPPLALTKQVRGRLKQVHWARTPKPLVSQVLYFDLKHANWYR